MSTTPRPSTSLSASAPAFSPTPPAVNDAEHLAQTTPDQDGLSGAAPAFSPAAGHPSQDTDIFAQTGAQQDDLFNDDFVPEESMQTRPAENLFDDSFVPVAEPVVEQPVPTSLKGRGGASRGRGRGRANYQSQALPQARPKPPAQQGSGRAADEEPKKAVGLEGSMHAPTAPRNPTVNTASVRGDRRATGGPQRAKLTEAELAEKMAAAKIRNEKATAAHARAEADRVAYAEREEKAEQKRKEERRDRQQMMGEREKNRLRKLKAQTGREWDAEKQEQDYDQRGGRGTGRGAHGGVTGARTVNANQGFGGDRADYTDGSEYIYREGANRGGDVRGGRGRGGRNGQARQQDTPTATDFPALPGSQSKETGSPVPGAKKAMTESSGAAASQSSAAISSWADQVESAVPP